MRGTSTVAKTGTAVAGVVASAGRTATAPVTKRISNVAWSWAAVPSGPLGWVSSRFTMPRLHAQLYRIMAGELALRPDDDLLDVACGSGAFLAAHAAHVRHVAGLDLSGIQVELARQRLSDRIAAGTAEIVKGDATALPWPEGTYSVVTVMGSFEAFPQPDTALSELFRVLRPSGRAVLNIGEQVPTGTTTHRVLDDTMWVWSEQDVRRMVEQSGFADVTFSYVSSGANRLDEVVSRLVAPVLPFAADLRLVHATKP